MTLCLKKLESKINAQIACSKENSSNMNFDSHFNSKGRELRISILDRYNKSFSSRSLNKSISISKIIKTANQPYSGRTNGLFYADDFVKLIGHSDADVGLHAICDSIFGALSMRDIGYHFPNTEKKWKNADSAKFINFCKEELLKKGYKIINLDLNIIAEKPKITKYVSSMKKKISTLLGIKTDIISIKATTNEKIGFIGNGEGIAAEAIVQISNEKIN